MEFLNNKISIKINEKTFLKDPESSQLGSLIISGSIDLINDFGFEEFTFKKLAKHIKSTEASVYRYFESKHNLLVYLVLWYWGWQEYRLVLSMINIPDPCERLMRAVKVLVEKIEEDSTFSQINEVKLNAIVISESSKAYLNKKVDSDNKLGFFTQYKDVVSRVSDIILEINPNYKYPHMLVSTVVEGAHHQRYFADHLPKLTDVFEDEDAITNFYQKMILNEIKRK